MRAASAEFGFELNIGDGHGGIDHLHACRNRGIYVGAHHAAPSNRSQRKTLPDDGIDGCDFFSTHGWCAGFDLRNAGSRQGFSDRDFFLDGKSDARGLFAIAQRRVIKKNRRPQFR
jgi:hypothetical protein